MSRKSAPSAETDDNLFSFRLRVGMAEKGLNQSALASAICVQRQTVSNYVLGQSIPDVYTLADIADALDVSADWLIGRPNAVRSLDTDIQAACRTLRISQNAAERLASLPNNAASDGQLTPKTAVDLFLQSEHLEMLATAIARIYSLNQLSPAQKTELMAEYAAFGKELGVKYGADCLALQEYDIAALYERQFAEAVEAIAGEIARYDGDIPPADSAGVVTVSLYDEVE